MEPFIAAKRNNYQPEENCKLQSLKDYPGFEEGKHAFNRIVIRTRKDETCKSSANNSM